MGKITKRITTVVLLLLVVSATFVIKVPSFNDPFSIDEGVYSYLAQNLSRGGILYADAFDLKPPALPYLYLFVQKVFGSSESSLRKFTACYTLLSTLAIFVLALFLYGRRVALLSAFFFGLFSGGVVLEGNTATGEVFMIFPMILSVLTFLSSLRRDSKGLLFLTGVLIGIAFLFKIVVIFNTLLFFVFLFIVYFNKKSSKKLISDYFSLTGGFLLALLPVFLFFWKKGALADFIFGTFMAGFVYIGTSYVKSYLFIMISKTITVFREGFLLWISSSVAIVYMLLNDRKKENIFLILWLIFSSFGVAISGRFYQHYYIQLMPALSILGGYAVTKIIDACFDKKCKFDIRNYFIVFALVGSLCMFFIINYPYYQNYFSYINGSISKDEFQSFFKYRHFPLNYKIASYLKDNSSKGDYVYIWGTDPVIYFLSERNSPTRYMIDYYGINIRGASDEIIRTISQKRPIFIVTISEPIAKLKEFLNLNYSIDTKIGSAIIYRKR